MYKVQWGPDSHKDFDHLEEARDLARVHTDQELSEALITYDEGGEPWAELWAVGELKCDGPLDIIMDILQPQENNP